MLRFDAVKVVVPQANELAITMGHAVQENISVLGLAKLAPIPVNVIVGLVDEATNRYHTSPRTVPEQAELPSEVALATVPTVPEHDVPAVNNTAVAQVLFAGTCANITPVIKSWIPNKIGKIRAVVFIVKIG